MAIFLFKPGIFWSQQDNRFCDFVPMFKTIKRTLDKKIVDVVQMFCEEMNKVKKELNNKRPYLSLQHPKYAGQAHWIKALKRRLENNFKVSTPSCFFGCLHTTLRAQRLRIDMNSSTI